MMECKWRDGKFEECKPALSALSRILNGAETSLNFDVLNYDNKPGFLEMRNQCFSFCPFCGADIRKPLQQPIIKKSGGTWVARYNGVDYLWVWSKQGPILNMSITNFEIKISEDRWKPISEIEITDDIANLHCKVKVYENIQKVCIRERKTAGGYLWNLATVSDLED